MPLVGFVAAHAAGKFLTGHERKLLGLKDQLIRGGAVCGDNPPQCADLTDVQNESARVDVPDGGNPVAIEIELRGFRGTPTGGDLRELANNERINIGAGRFFIVEIGADVADVGIGQADDLASVTGIGENLLVAGETGIENDFTAAARDSAGRAAVKYAPVFERKNGRSVRDFCQIVLRTASFITGLGR